MQVTTLLKIPHADVTQHRDDGQFRIVVRRTNADNV